MVEYMIKPDDILGTSEVAKVLGVSKQRIHALRKNERFPKPFHSLASTPLWDKREINAFIVEWRPWKADSVEA